MDSEHLIRYILEDKEYLFPKVFEYRFDGCERFKKLIYHYRDKIRAKVRGAATKDDLEDIIHELEIPYLLLLDNRFEVEYEKYGLGIRAPDYYVTFEQSVELNVEVKRIREANLGTRFDNWYQEIKQRISKIPSNIGVMIDIVDLDPSLDLMNRLESSMEAIVQLIRVKISEEEESLPYEGSYKFLVPGFEDEDSEVSVELFRFSQKARINRTSLCGGLMPIFITGKEFRKFGDTIFDKLGQMVPGLINLLVIISTSTAHDRWHLNDSIYSINNLLRKDDIDFFIQKGFQGKEDFLRHVKSLSAVLFRSTWVGQGKDRNALWCNDQADQKVPERIKQYLKKMDRPMG